MGPSEPALPAQGAPAAERAHQAAVPHLHPGQVAPVSPPPAAPVVVGVRPRGRWALGTWYPLVPPGYLVPPSCPWVPGGILEQYAPIRNP